MGYKQSDYPVAAHAELPITVLRACMECCCEPDSYRCDVIALRAAVPEVISAPRKADVPRVYPTMAHPLHSEPIAALSFQGGKIVTVDRVGVAKIWAPQPPSEE